jgi:glycopeptide antibiotics resistance protein
MKDTTKSPDILTLAVFAAYLYLLVKIILFKGGHVDVHVLIQQFQLTLQDPGRILLRPFNLIPFHEIKRDMHNLSMSNPFLNINLTGNILAFIPLGIFIPILGRRKRVSAVTMFLLSLGLSLCFESTQFLLAIGTFDVDDLILNTLGGVAGYILYRIIAGPSIPKQDNEASRKGENTRSERRLAVPEQ